MSKRVRVPVCMYVRLVEANGRALRRLMVGPNKGGRRQVHTRTLKQPNRRRGEPVLRCGAPHRRLRLRHRGGMPRCMCMSMRTCVSLWSKRAPTADDTHVTPTLAIESLSSTYTNAHAQTHAITGGDPRLPPRDRDGEPQRDADPRRNRRFADVPCPGKLEYVSIDAG